MQTTEKDPKIDQLLKELTVNRDSLKKKLLDLENFNSQVQKVFPNTLDYKNKFLIDDKVKIVTGFYSTLLNYLQELNRSVKEEIEIRRRIATGEEESKEQNIRDIIKEFSKQGLVVPGDTKKEVNEQTKPKPDFVFVDSDVKSEGILPSLSVVVNQKETEKQKETENA